MASSTAGRPTLAKVAERAGVSVSTASLAFSGAGPISAETRDRVLTAAQELGYSGPNPLGRQLRSGRSGIVGVVIGDNPGRAFRDPVSVQVLDGLMQVLGEQGLGVLLVPGLRPEASAPCTDAAGHGEPPAATVAGIAPVDPLVESAAMDVAVLVWGVLTDDPNVTALQRRGVRVVVGEGHAVEGAPLVRIDDRAGAAEAARHLQALGHTRIAEITLPFGRGERSGPVDATRRERADRTPALHRMAGVRDVVEPVITWETPASLVEHGREAAMEILGQWVPDSERPTAIFAHSDLLAAGAVLAARELGLRVPEDVSIAGFDGLDLPWLSPDVLTSVNQPLREKGEALGRAVVGLLAGDAPEVQTLPVRLVQGTTTGPAPR
ncbi:transcriptional regulator, LacI family [Xylanimonas cellulosilytica DSM 15894]|uniref:Transcriptional regulator, LacI family n=1 Tax=Xylanimonas cellulosilytica (strain DSM 15894 / JCM 12276 / CECT 5975 / KCTC 9989 / LMG 20990 / NBRC 107835 / XIL07) TaxID=446471 RepID=D1BWQ8_XYLCX|nr:LacI family DNA-binding transcriptional regulator [Xylanimonas cellulosilytica]ACZ29640.1 transcriptional regulator, LacI family [Xylanimonas cellulosilytica DSM 15894]